MEVSPFLAKILSARGIVDPQQVLDFLNPNLERDWTNPIDINGMEDVVNAVESAMLAGKRILIYGDYDLDGISATCVMMQGLHAINKHINSGMTVDYFLPKRFTEGYGFTEKSVNRLLNMEVLPEVIITVDCGITADKEIQILKNHGIEVIVTDHHEKSDNLPKDVCMIDPKADKNDDKNSILAGVGVALKLISALGARYGLPYAWMNFIDLATLGTLADIMPLIGQNRSLVFEGVKQINENSRPSIRALLDIAGKSIGKLTAKDLTYILTPRLNAAGRMDMAEVAVELLMSQTYADAYNFALQIENLNNQRREITNEVYEEVDKIVRSIIKSNSKKRSLVIAGDKWHPGILGIVAAKIAEKYNLPCFVLTIKDGIAHGSGRSIGNIDLHKACMECFNRYVKFGGHKKACGITLDQDNILEFSESFEKYMQAIDEREFCNKINFDIEVNLNELTISNVASLNLMEPFGPMNEQPVLLAKDVFIKRAKAVGQMKNHLYCNITDGVYGGQAIMFNVEDINKYLDFAQTVSVLFSPKVEEFQGKENVKLHLSEILINKDNQNENINLNEMFNNWKSKNNKISSVGDFINDSVKKLSHDAVSKSHESAYFQPVYEKDLEKFNNKNTNDVQRQIIEAMIGKDGELHNSQQETLNLLADGNSVLSVMPTGRGKSLIFQVYASTLALCENKTSIFVYPLRALISDQAFHLQKNLSKFGLNIKVLNGETPQQQRDECYEMLKNNKLDIVLTTPEFLAIHIDKIADVSKIGFVVVDESHHLGQVKIGDRTAYGYMPQVLEKLDNPQVLALSATVSDEVCAEIKKFLPINKIVKDNFERSNIFVDDRRNIKSRDDYLVALCASGEKIVIYVNSRQQTVDLARMIKSRAPKIAMQVGFYNAGMSREDRNKIEDLFRCNKLSVLVSTSAFGEGVNIPDIRHVCLYHLPFSNVEFNQMAGRCGRDNNPAIVHLLFNRADATINTQILEMTNPSDNQLRIIYTAIRNNINASGGLWEFCHEKHQEMFEQAVTAFSAASVIAAVDIFSELGLIKVETIAKDNKTYSKIQLVETPVKVKLENSSRFCEGRNELKNFEDYRLNAMRKTANELTQLLRHPILPTDL